MRLTGIRIRGFRGVRDSLDLQVPPGFLVICGRNGSGKSTVCDAVEFALTGTLERHEHAKESGESLLHYLWWRGETAVSDRDVALSFDDDDPEVRRGMDQSQPAVAQLLERFVVGRNDPESIQELCRTTILRADTIAEHSLDLSEPERYKFVRRAVGGTGSLARAETRLVEVTKSTSRWVGDAQREYDDARAKLNELTAALSTARAEAARVRDVAKAESELRALLERPDSPIVDLLEAARAQLSEAALEVPRLKDLASAVERLLADRQALQTEEHQRRLQETQTEIAAMRDEIEAQLLVVSELEREVDALGGDEQLRSLAELQELGRLLGLRGGTCPLCGSHVSSEDFQGHLRDLREEVERDRASLTEVVRRRTEAHARLASLRQRQAVLQTEHETHASITNEVVEREVNLLGQVSERIGSSETRVTPDVLASLVAARGTREEKAAGVQRALAIVEASRALEELSVREREHRDATTALQGAEERLRRLEHAHARASTAVGAVRRLMGEIIEERLAALSPLMVEMYARLRPHVDWPDLDYRLRGDVRKFLSLRVGDDLNPRFMFSSGQRRAAGLAFLLAVHFSRPWSRLDTLILDDPVQHVDDFRALHLVEVLSAIRQSGRQVICTVEDPALADLLCRRLRNRTAEDGLRVDLEYSVGRGVRKAGETPIPPLKRRLLRSA